MRRPPSALLWVVPDEIAHINLKPTECELHTGDFLKVGRLTVLRQAGNCQRPLYLNSIFAKPVARLIMTWGRRAASRLAEAGINGKVFWISRELAPWFVTVQSFNGS